MPFCFLVCCWLLSVFASAKGTSLEISREDTSGKCRYPTHGKLDCSNISFKDGMPLPAKLQYERFKSLELKDLFLPVFAFLKFKNCSISEIPKDYFYDFYNAKALDLSVNNLAHLHEDVFSYCIGLIFIELDHNVIEELPQGIFRELRYLKYLDLSFNRIANLPEDIFRGLYNLEMLALNDNRLVSLEAKLFKGLNSLAVLSLDKNRLKNLPKRVFQGLLHLDILALRGNKLYILPNGLLKNLNRLAGVDFADNNLIVSGNWDIKRNENIQALTFTNNKMLELDPFMNSKSLQAILLQNNRISMIKSHSFLNLAKVLIINLSENRINTIEWNSFVNVPSLKHLLLSNNQIVQMSGIFCVNMSLSSLSLTNNPIQHFDSSFFENSSLEILFAENTNISEFVFVSRSVTSSRETQIFLNPSNAQAPSKIEAVIGNGDLTIILGFSGVICQKDGYCTLCSIGSFTIVPTIDSTNQFCYNCPAGGFFQDNIGHVTTNFDVYKGCKLCPPGTYVSIENAPGKSSLDCKKCPSGTRFSEFAGFRACKCLPGFYRTDRFGPCMKCPTDGIICRNELIFLKPGFFWVWDSSPQREAFRNLAKNLEIKDETYNINTTKFIGCFPPAYSCPVREACKGWIFSECAEGYTGVLCNVCVEGYYKSASLGCKKCSISWIALQFAIILFFIVSFTTLVTKKKRKDKSGRSLSDILMSQIKIVIGFYQVSLGMIQSFSFIDWPENLNKYIEYANILQLNLFQALPLRCIIPGFTFNPFYKMVTTILGNVFVIIIATIIYCVRKSYISKKDLPEQKKNAAISSAKETNYRFIIFFLFVTFPTTCMSIITVMPATCQEVCSEKSCTWYLKADYRVKCYDTYYYKWLTVAWIAVFYPVALLVITFRLLWKCSTKTKTKTKTNNAEDHPENKELRLASSFLFENYSRKFWYWELVETTRKVVFTSGVFLISNGSRIHVMVAASFSILYGLLFAFIKPMKQSFDNVVQLASLLATFVNFSLAAVLRISKESTENDFGDNQDDEAIISNFLIATNALLLLPINWFSLKMLYPNIKAWFLNPKFSLKCCLATVVSFTGITSNFTSASGPDSNVELPSIQDTLNDQLALDIEEFNYTEETEKDSNMIVQKFLKRRAWASKTEEDEVSTCQGYEDRSSDKGKNVSYKATLIKNSKEN